MDIEKDNLAINEKYNLTIKEAVKYFNIGEKNLRRLVSDNPNADYILTWKKQKLKLEHEYYQCRMKFMQHSRG